MKKSILILVAFSFFGLELNAQLLNEGSGKIFRNAGGADRGGSTAGSSVFGAQGDWSVDLVVSEQTPATAANNFLGPTHNGMGATGWGSFAAGAYNRASGAGAVAIGFHNVAGPLDSDESSIPTSGNTTNLGQFAVGYGTQATGHVAFSAGQGTTASGDFSLAMGRATTASGSSSTAMGRGTIASGDDSTALGANTEASGNSSTAMGSNTQASGMWSIAAGANSTAIGTVSLSFGYESMASGDNATAIGYRVTASDRSSLVIGEYNLLGSTVTNSATQFSTDNTAFVIGNGSDSNNRSDALVVKFSGDATLAGNLNINSDARLKANIVSLGGTLSKLLQIDGKSYTMKKDESEKQKIGLLAQDIEKVFPELVSESHGVKSVNYQGLVPILINALKEQDNRLSKQQSEIDRLKNQEKRLERLERLVAAMD